MKVRTIPLPFATLTCNTTTATFLPVTGFVPTENITRLRQSWEVAQVTGNFQGVPAFQVANNNGQVTGSSYAIGSEQSTTGLKYATSWMDVTTHLGGYQLMRFGWLVSNTTAAVRSSGHVGGRIEAASD